MKKIKKVLSMFLAVLMFSSFIPQSIYAASNTVYNDDIKIIDDALQVVSETETYLQSRNSSIVEELKSLKEENERRLNLIKDEDKVLDDNSSRAELDEEENIKDQIKVLDSAILEMNLIDSDSNKYLNKSSIEPANDDIDTTLRLAVYAVIAYFHSNNYKLAAELLGKAHANNTEGIDYYPTNGKIVRKTKLFEELMREPSYENDSATFKGGSTTAEMDAYYAIHKFRYSKYGNSIRIHDIYDYDNTKNYEGIAGTAVDTMWVAEVRGILTPFRTVIDEKK